MSATHTTFTIKVPIPPYELSKNGRLNPWQRNAVYQQYKMVARNEINRKRTAHDRTHYGAVRVHVTWYAHRRPFPDSDNAIGRCAAYIDAAEETGLIANDDQVQDVSVEFYIDRDNPHAEVRFLFKEGTDA
jgi:Holliday junction resolvase RusA-like endonuclease